MKTYRRTKEQKERGIRRYFELWGNYKSDKWKSKTILRAEIKDIISLLPFNKKELIEIKNLIKKGCKNEV